MFKIGQIRIAFEAPGEGGGAGGEGGTAHPVAAPWAEAEGVWSFGEGDAAQPWHSAIPEDEARAHVEAKGYKNPAELALANYSLTKLQRGDPTVVGLPGQEATPEQWGEFYGKLGRPDTAEGYEFSFGEGVTVDDGMLKFGRDAFHEAGLSPKQAQIVADKWNTFMAEQTEGHLNTTTEENDKGLAELSSRWGADLDKNKAAGNRVVQALGLSNDLIGKVEQEIGSAAIVELLATIGRKSDEGGLLGGDENGGGDNPDTMTKEQANSKIATLQGDVEFQKKYTDKNHPGHKDALDMMQRLYARA